MADLESTSWDETDANNTARFPENQLPSTVNDGARALEGAIKREWNRSHATHTSAGAASLTFTVSYSVNPTAYVRGNTYVWKAHQNCGNAARFGISGLATKLMMKPTKDGLVTISASDIVTNQIVRCDYDASLDAMIVTSGLVLPTTIGVGTVTMVIAGSGLSGGSISTTGTLAVDATEWTLTTTISESVDQVVFYDPTAAALRRVTFDNALLVAGGRVIQQVEFSSSSVSTTTTVLPIDDSIPQNTEGSEFLSVTITPINTNDILIIDWEIQVATNTGGVQIGVGLFQDATANALMARGSSSPAVNTMVLVTGSYRMSAGTVSATTFRVRAGPQSAGTVTFNGEGGARRFGGVAYSFIRVTEISTRQ